MKSLTEVKEVKAPAVADKAGLFAALNKGTDITSGNYLREKEKILFFLKKYKIILPTTNLFYEFYFFLNI